MAIESSHLTRDDGVCREADVMSRWGEGGFGSGEPGIATYRLPKVLPQRSQPHENGFSFVCVLSCL